MGRIDVGPRPTSRDELAVWYSEALAAQAASGLSVAEFAGRIGVSVPTLYSWRRRLEASPPRESSARLVELTMTRTPAMMPDAPSASAMVVRLCSGRRSIDVPAGFDDAELRRLVAALESC
ncbi:helix-turn-helix domain-containing protein [Accumulibacter sp.]|uniref:IS66 family insertion sequence element accessory protein TnpA n=1 Tax=Accumulibacter sp. TaxID=2053492 RepID=UPI0035AF4FA4